MFFWTREATHPHLTNRGRGCSDLERLQPPRSEQRGQNRLVFHDLRALLCFRPRTNKGWDREIWQT